MAEQAQKLPVPVPLNFHGHLLPGNILLLSEIIPYKMKIDWDLARWFCYNPGLFTPHIGSVESVLLRTALRRFIEAIYNDWENVVALVPVKAVESAIDEMQKIIEISKEFPVMLWQFIDVDRPAQTDWVTTAKNELPSLESLNRFFELPHMWYRFIAVSNGDFYRDDERQAEKDYRKAFAAKNRRLNRVAKEQSRGNKKI